MKASPTYHGQPIKYAHHDRSMDTYSLIGADGECVAELSSIEFLSFRNRSNLEVRSGRYRAAGSKDQRGADRIAGDPGRDDPLFAINTINRPGSALTPRDLARAYASFGPGLTSSILHQMMKDLIGEEQAKPALKRDGVIAGEIVGYRCWRIQRGDPRALIGRLRSVYQSDVWNPGAVLEGRELGDWDSRGIHAWKDSGSKEYHDYIRGYLNRGSDNPFRFAFNNGDSVDPDQRPAMVTGTVFLWGDVVEHERGWRAEFARVRSLDWLYPDALMMGRETEALNDLRKLYGISSPIT